MCACRSIFISLMFNRCQKKKKKKQPSSKLQTPALGLKWLMMDRTFPAINMLLWERRDCLTKTELMDCMTQKCGNLITETGNGWGWQGPLEVIQPNPPVQGSPPASSPELHPGGFWISPEKETAQPLCEASSSALPSHTHKLLTRSSPTP